MKTGGTSGELRLLSLDLGAAAQHLILRKFSKWYTYDMSTFLNGCYTSKNKFKNTRAGVEEARVVPAALRPSLPSDCLGRWPLSMGPTGVLSSPGSVSSLQEGPSPQGVQVPRVWPTVVLCSQDNLPGHQPSPWASSHLTRCLQGLGRRQSPLRSRPGPPAA